MRSPSLRTPALAGLLLALSSPGLDAAEPTLVTLEPPGVGAQVRLSDVDGDGLADLLTLTGRTLRIWSGGRGTLPGPTPRWSTLLPDDVSFVDVARSAQPSLLCLGASGATRLTLGLATPRVAALEGAAPLGWRDSGRAVFLELHPTPGDAAFLVPAANGWTLWSPGTPTPLSLDLSPQQEVGVVGSRLEEVTTLQQGLPRVLAPRARGVTPQAGALTPCWAVTGDQLVRVATGRRDVYDLSFLPTKGERRLEDLDGDGVPEVLHRDGENREARYAFFRLPTPPAGAGADAAPPVGDLRPPFAFLRLSGFNLEPSYVDLDGDGRLDVVVTTIEIDAANTLRAVASGKVTSVTRAYLQRVGADGRPVFPPQPDAAVSSDIGVKIRFGYTGNLDIKRSFTIIVDGDLDGDGRNDLVIRTGPERLSVWAGSAQGVWAHEPRSVAMPRLAAGEELEAHAADLDGDLRDELILHVRAAAEERLHVLRLP